MRGRPAKNAPPSILELPSGFSSRSIRAVSRHLIIGPVALGGKILDNGPSFRGVFTHFNTVPGLASRQEASINLTIAAFKIETRPVEPFFRSRRGKKV